MAFEQVSSPFFYVLRIIKYQLYQFPAQFFRRYAILEQFVYRGKVVLLLSLSYICFHDEYLF